MIKQSLNLYLLISFFLVLASIKVTATSEKSFVIITASYNNKDWYQRNLDSIFSQTYPNWRLVYINDFSTDGTGELVQEYVQAQGMQDKVLQLNNKRRRGHLANQYNAIHMCAKNEIIVIVDGDDWLAHTNVLEYLNYLYQQEDILMTYGQFWYLKRNTKGVCRPLPESVVEDNSIRDHPSWVLSHLRTFYAGLFQLIKLEDLLYQGNYYPMCADISTMYPMFEMAAERARFIPDILYVYNDANQLSFFQSSDNKQRQIWDYIKQQKRYTRLETIDFT
jgi:glycosyltransferase involved in cell wall biosynthesis